MIIQFKRLDKVRVKSIEDLHRVLNRYRKQLARNENDEQGVENESRVVSIAQLKHRR